MKNIVILKGNRYGISIVLDPEAEFSLLLKALKEKLAQAEHFFDSDRQLAVAFEGRKLTNEELDQILTVIQENSKLNIQYVMDEDSDLEATFYDIIQSAGEPEEPAVTGETEPLVEVTGLSEADTEDRDASGDSTGMFYRGTLRSGQTLEAKESLVVVGDINPGATVIAGGNIVVIGSLRGNAIAGCNGNTNAFVMALFMEPMQIQIADVIARSGDAPEKTGDTGTAKIATIVHNQICIDSMDSMQDIHF
jgi:septum site-determining protein MinC